MNARLLIVFPLLAAPLVLGPSTAPACCPAPPSGKPVVNADQTVVILWDAERKTQHFIRQASFKSDADDFGFLIPSPSKPELDESGNEAFSHLRKLTEPEVIKRARPSGGMSCGCGGEPKSASKDKAPAADKDKKAQVRVLEEKRVAGFHATVLEADNTDVLAAWLASNGYAFSPEVKAWAKPYVDGNWKITALKVAKGPDGKSDRTVAASALRLSFQTERPLFPYREPDTAKSAEALGARNRLLRIYFLADGRYQGELTKDVAWSGKPAWSGKLTADDRQKLLQSLKLPETTGPAEWWLTEFEDNWPYKVAPADVYFSRDGNQLPIKRDPIIQYVEATWPRDVSVYALALGLFVPVLCVEWVAIGLAPRSGSPP
jgi:hypothetical protein